MQNNYFTEMCSGSEAGSYLIPIDFLFHSTLGLRVMIKKKKKSQMQKAEKLVKHSAARWEQGHAQPQT